MPEAKRRRRAEMSRRGVLGLLLALPFGNRARAGPPADWALRLVRAAEAQIGVTTIYDPAYVRLVYPGGDVPADRGVCTDVVIRAYRALGFDLQKTVHEDMACAFSAYPKRWGLKRPDRNIDHRRVDNLRVFLKRRGAELPVDGAVWEAGDLATLLLPGNLPHIGIVSADAGPDGLPLLVHNIGAGARKEAVLGRFRVTGRYRFPPPG